MANDVQKRNAFIADLEAVINKHSLENGSGTPDYILATYLWACIETWNASVKTRDRWWGFDANIGGVVPAVDPAPEDKPVHTYPTEDIIEHDTDGGNCPCKPTIEAVIRDDGTVGQHVIHNALDGRRDG